MPKINLKPGSAEYEDPKKPQEKSTICDMAGCKEHGEFKAPKNRGLNEYYHFCLEHVREYNKAWNFFDGMSDSDVERATVDSIYGDRPTWKYGVNGDFTDKFYKQAWQFYNFSDDEPPVSREKKNSPEAEAMEIMGLSPPLTLKGIQTRYRELAKKHHPDLNRDDPKAEELLKSINMAYTILKVAYESYGKLN